MEFDGKVAVVTGSAQGIGEAYAKGLASRGAAVVVADLNVAEAERVAKEIDADGGRAAAIPVDVADPASADAMAAAASATFGGIDFLVNNAAIYAGMRIDSLISVDLEYYRRFMDVNLHGALVVTRACFPYLQVGGGAIVNQSSTAAWMAGGYYSMAKAGINSLTVCLASELSHSGIRVNAIAPGPTDTAATRAVVPGEFMDALVGSLMLKRLGTPEDMVGALCFLLSDEASWVTGHVFAVDGGQIIRT
jgi:NAD(P)-dependent dehydrogenase (short-subunit alcohol dehydrogenase family)